ncbi:hypothetical protein AB0A71_38040 [Kitasatospora aureofaciens]|uniref:hypothetical protein n=1 Tax=Kitasatospora aureofaciens TaxID=1894 RepID=UPI0033BFEAF6
MTRLLRRAAIFFLATAAISGLAVPATASTRGGNRTQLEICNVGAPDQKFSTLGYNQFGDRVRSYTAHIPPYQRYWMTTWWWRTNHAVEGDVPDGGWQQATIYD